MKMLFLQGFPLIAGAEVVALMTHQRQFVLWAAALAAALLIGGARRLLIEGGSPAAAPPTAIDEPGEALRRWRSGTEARLRWAESTRADWDRRWRPILAGRFEISSGQGRLKDPVAFEATGALLFGAQLWTWVDPSNVAPRSDTGPGPGRAVLEQILCRLEQG
ncbi:hypothetical protein [Mycobacterium sp. UM_Kg1]|uniref:hypothetical protein n=1 Tax=Mycobacterium sp. UM_Kg1 TaxID=1545691 RepID=UPI00061B4E23|nr:hypothetical protein [Mycobacterium sp. UM_Kg1]